MEPTGQDLFEIKLNASGKIFIRKFVFFARVMILLGMIITFVHIASSVIESRIDRSAYAGYKYLLLDHKLLPYYTAAWCLLFFPQMYFYWQVTRFFKKGLNYNDEATFNKAFRALSGYAVFGVATLILSLFSYGFELFIYIKYYLK